MAQFAATIATACLLSLCPATRTQPVATRDAPLHGCRNDSECWSRPEWQCSEVRRKTMQVLSYCMFRRTWGHAPCRRCWRACSRSWRVASIQAGTWSAFASSLLSCARPGELSTLQIGGCNGRCASVRAACCHAGMVYALALGRRGCAW
jgi:hypothetical protein